MVVGECQRDKLEVIRCSLSDTTQRLEYEKLFESCDDAFIQQSTYWAEAIKDLGPDEPIFIICRQGGKAIAGMPLYLYRHSLGNVMTSIPQAGSQGGLFCTSGLDGDVVDEMYAMVLECAELLASKHDCIALSIITNPFFDDTLLYERHLQPTYVFETFTQSLVVQEEVVDGRIACLERDRQSNLSRNARKAAKAGFTVRWAESDADLEAWYALHARRHTEIGLTPLPKALVSNIWRILKPLGKCALQLVWKSDELAAGCLYILHQRVMDVFMPAIDARFTSLGPNYLTTIESLPWALGRGIRIYNWESSPSRASGVYRFKEQWGSRESRFQIVSKLLCHADRIRDIGADKLRQEYPMHFVVPFGVFEIGFATRCFKK